ncbi:MAG TPA: SpoIIE family protein phosphatase [Anaerolineae bacterium]|nr:SpoIIE family protein phosphatase [Anaerolineae bacterium]
MQGQNVDVELELHIGVAKVGKYATSESGDTLEMVERPYGGLSLVLVDGQRSGRAAKLISNLAARKAVSLLAEGVRDGAAARAAHDYLRAHRKGKVSAELSIVSLDLETHTLVISRNSHCPVFVVDQKGLCALDEASQAIGIYAWTKPVITELPIVSNTWAIVFTDGILDAGRRFGEALDVATLVSAYIPKGGSSAPALADVILARAVELDRGRPQDDMSVVVLALLPRVQTDDARRLTVRFPLPPF